jgi:hypothetical protein
LTKEEIPTDWKVGLLCSIYKKGDPLYLLILKQPMTTLTGKNFYLVMKYMEIPDKLIILTKLTMTDNYATVKLRDVLSGQFDIKEGVRQGDPLACLLFNMSLEEVIRDTEVDTRGTIFNN